GILAGINCFAVSISTFGVMCTPLCCLRLLVFPVGHYGDTGCSHVIPSVAGLSRTYPAAPLVRATGPREARAILRPKCCLSDRGDRPAAVSAILPHWALPPLRPLWPRLRRGSPRCSVSRGGRRPHGTA